MRTSVPKISECYPFLIHCSGTFGRKRNIGNTSENIKCGNLMKNCRKNPFALGDAYLTFFPRHVLTK